MIPTTSGVGKIKGIGPLSHLSIVDVGFKLQSTDALLSSIVLAIVVGIVILLLLDFVLHFSEVR